MFFVLLSNSNNLKMESKKKKIEIGSLLFVGCMFIGGGLGMLFDAVEVGGAIGMGVGFIAMAVVMALSKHEQQ